VPLLSFAFPERASARGLHGGECRTYWYAFGETGQRIPLCAEPMSREEHHNKNRARSRPECHNQPHGNKY